MEDVGRAIQRLKPLDLKILLLLTKNRELTIDGIIYYLSVERIYINKSIARRRMLKLQRLGLVEKKHKMVKEFMVKKLAVFYKLSRSLKRRKKLLDKVARIYRSLVEQIPYRFSE